MSRAGELLLYFGGVALFYYISLFGRCCSILSEVEVWYAGQESDTTMLGIVENAGIKIYNTRISTQISNSCTPGQIPQFTKINDLLLII